MARVNSPAPLLPGSPRFLHPKKLPRGALTLFTGPRPNRKESALALSARYFEARCLENVERKDEAQNLYQQVAEVKNPNPYRDDCPSRRRHNRARARTKGGRVQKNYEVWQMKRRGGVESRGNRSRRNGRSGPAADREREIDKTWRRKSVELAAERPLFARRRRWRSVAEVGLLRLQYQSGQYEKSWRNTSVARTSSRRKCVRK